MKITIDQGLAAARAIRAQWPQSRVSLHLVMDSGDGDWRGDRTIGLDVRAENDPATRAEILSRSEWSSPFATRSENTVAMSLEGTLCGVPVSLWLPAVERDLDADAWTFGPDGVPVRDEVTVTAFVSVEANVALIERVTTYHDGVPRALDAAIREHDNEIVRAGGPRVDQFDGFKRLALEAVRSGVGAEMAGAVRA